MFGMIEAACTMPALAWIGSPAFLGGAIAAAGALGGVLAWQRRSRAGRTAALAAPAPAVATCLAMLAVAVAALPSPPPAASADSLIACDDLAGDPNDPETWAGRCAIATRAAEAQDAADRAIAIGAIAMAIAAIACALTWRRYRRPAGGMQGTNP